MQALKEAGIGTRPFFYPMHKQPAFHNMGLFLKDTHPNAERLAERGFYIPSGIALTDKEITRVSQTLRKIVEN